MVEWFVSSGWLLSAFFYFAIHWEPTWRIDQHLPAASQFCAIYWILLLPSQWFLTRGNNVKICQIIINYKWEKYRIIKTCPQILPKFHKILKMTKLKQFPDRRRWYVHKENQSIPRPPAIINSHVNTRRVERVCKPYRNPQQSHLDKLKP